MLVSILALSLMYGEHKMYLLPFCALSTSKLVIFTLITLFDSFSSLNCAAPGKTLLCPGRRTSIRIGHWTTTGMGIKSLTLCRSYLKPYCTGRKSAFFQWAFKFRYCTRNRSPPPRKKIITIKLKKTD